MNAAACEPVYVSGIGVVSPLAPVVSLVLAAPVPAAAAGEGLDAFDAALFAGRSALSAFTIDLPGIDAATVAVARCAFDESRLRTPSRLPADRSTAMALLAAEAALAQAGLGTTPGVASDLRRLNATRLGVFWGSGMGGAQSFDTTSRALYVDHKRIRPTSVVTTMPNAALAEVALLAGAQGAALGYACACASSAVAIGEAMRAIRGGWIDVAIAGGSEALLTPAIIASWQAMRVLAVCGADDAAGACAPFSAGRSGFALGEGAAALVLESAAHARGRHAAAVKNGLVLSGYATNCDGVHITNPDASGQARAMRAALADAGVRASEIGYVNAHGTATQAGDLAEAQSIAQVFGASAVPVSSTKAIHGHLLGAGGAVEMVAALRALSTRRLPPNGSVAAADPACHIDLLTGEARAAPGLRHVMSNSFAFGGTNAVLVASRLG